MALKEYEITEFFSEIRTDEECVDFVKKMGQAKRINADAGRAGLESIINVYLAAEMLELEVSWPGKIEGVDIEEEFDVDLDDALDEVLADEPKKEKVVKEKKDKIQRESNPKLSKLGKEIVRFYKDACYGNGINDTISRCNTEKADKSRKWAATYDANDNSVWECCTCGCQWARSERK